MALGRSKIFISIWILFHLILCLNLITNPPKIETNILNLVSDTSNSILKNVHSELELSKDLMEHDSKKIDILIESASEKSLITAEKALKDSFKSIQELSAVTSENYKNIDAYLKNLSDKKEMLLTEKQSTDLEKITPKILVDSIKKKLNSSESPIFIKFLPHDPLLLLADRLIELSKEYHVKTPSTQHVKLLSFKIGKTITEDKKVTLANSINEVITSVHKNNNDTHIYWTGFIKFQTSSSQIIKREIEILSCVATILSVVTLLYTFRSPYPLILSSLSLLSGFLFAVVVTKLAYNQIHLLTIGFGSSLMGACVDYSIHYISEFYFPSSIKNSKEKIHHVIKPIAIGALTSIISFVFLYFGNFSGLSELALFSILGLTASFLTVFILFPFLLHENKNTGNSRIAAYANFFFRIPSLLTKDKKSTISLTLLYLIVLGIAYPMASTNDDMRLLQLPQAELIETQKHIEEVSGKKTPRAYILSSGTSLKDALNNTEILKEKLDTQKIADNSLTYFSVAKIIPSEAQQTLSYNAYKKFLDQHEIEIKKLLHDEGFEERLIKKISISADKNNLIDIHSFLESDIGNSLNQLILKTSTFVYVITPIFNYTDRSFIEEIKKDSSVHTVIEIKYEIENAFKSFRKKSILMTCFAYALILLYLIYLYGIYEGFLLFLPSVLTAITTLACMSLSNIPINFFSILALIIVLGLCVDYSVFYKEEQSDATKVSVFLSTITSLFTFGILAFSSTPVLQSFGVVIGIGVVLSQFFSAMLCRPDPN